MFERLFSSMNIGNCEIKNRLVVPAMVTQTCSTDGILSERYIAYHEEKAKGGWGLIITENYGVSADARGYSNIPGLWNDEQIEKNKEFTDCIHKYGTKIFCQIYHAGKQKMPNVPGQAVAPSAIKDPMAMNFPRELTVEEIHQIVKDFGSAAARVKKAGFDGLEIHAGHGYLIAQFLSPFVNKRTDEYGGCFENRVRFFDEIYAEVRKNVGDDFPISVRYSLNEYVTGGRTEAESYELALHFEALGANVLNVSNGAYASDPDHHVISTMFAAHAFNMDTAEQIKKLVNIPVMLVNRINDPRMAETLLTMNKADFIVMGRGSIADPHLPEKTQEGRLTEINYCIGCLQGCEMGIISPMGFTCLVNPHVAREYEGKLKEAETKKKVLIAGTGPAGMMAARTAAQCGHSVTVYDKDTHFGGAFRSAAYPMGKGELSTVISGYREECLKLGVTFKMGTEVTEEVLAKEKLDAVILATGSRPFTPPIKGADGSNVIAAEDILLGNADIPAGPVVVCGGGEVGGETAEFIAQSNHDVTIVEMRSDILVDMVPFSKISLVGRMKNLGVKTITGAAVSEITEDSVSFKYENGEEATIPANLVVSAFGYRAYNPLEEIAHKYCDNVQVVGSAVKAGNAMTATKEGYEAALNI